jgi:hypothetical protein
VTSNPEERRLLVSARQVARFWGITPIAVRQAGDTGLLTQHRTPRANGAAEDAEAVRYDADQVLEMGRRPFVDERQLVAAFDPWSVLFVQQAGPRWLHHDDEDFRWRSMWGWTEEASDEEKLLSASGWWPVDPRRRDGVRAIVSTVSSFVVTLAVVDPKKPVEAVRPDIGRVRLNVSAATEDTTVGRALLSVFRGRRLPVKSGSNRLIPQPGECPFG